MTAQTFTRVAEGVVQRGPRQFLARTWRGGPTKTFATKQLAVAWRRDAMAKRDKGAPVIVRKSTATVAEECTRWLAANRRHLTAPTFQVYEIRLRRQVQHPKHGLGAVRLSALTWEAVEAWTVALESAGVSARTVNQAKSVLGLVLDGAVKADPPRLAANPVRMARSLPLPKQAPVDAVSLDDADAVTDALRGRYRIVALLALGAGLRLGEALGVKPEDVDADALVLHVRRQYGRTAARKGATLPKGAKTRVVPISAALARELRRHQRVYGTSTAGTLTSLPSGGPLFAQQWDQEWERARTKAGVELGGIHQLRHAYGSHLAAAGETVANISRWMGHASTATTHAYYFHAVPDARPATDLTDRSARAARTGRKSRTNRALKVVS